MVFILKEHGLKRSDVKIPAPVVKKVIASYTREAGVRGLDRALSTVARKITRRLVEAEDKSEPLSLPVTVRVGDLKEYLG